LRRRSGTPTICRLLLRRDKMSPAEAGLQVLHD
jgi:hypothetical protein